MSAQNVPSEDPSRFVESKASPAARLGVAHLLLWMTFSAVAVATGLVSTPYALRREFLAAAPPIDLLLITATAGICGAAMTGVLVMGARRVRGVPLPTDPGHWMLLAVAAKAIVIGGAHSVDWSAIPRIGWQDLAPGQRLAIVFGLGGLQCAVVAAIWLWAALRSRGGPWKLLFFAAVVTSAVGFVLAGADVGLHLANPAFGGLSRFSHAGNVVYYLVAPLLTAVLLALAIAVDVRLKVKRRGWLHWTGIVVLAADVLLIWGWKLEEQLFLR